MMKPIIAVIGSGGDLNKSAKDAAFKIGGDIAVNDCVLICGGKGGVMGAACAGAKSRGGFTIGILPSTDRTGANNYLDIVLTTGLSHARNAVIVSSSDAVISITGGAGTMSEIGLALSYGKPTILVKGTGGISDSDFGELDFSNLYRAEVENAVSLCLDIISGMG